MLYAHKSVNSCTKSDRVANVLIFTEFLRFGLTEIALFQEILGLLLVYAD